MNVGLGKPLLSQTTEKRNNRIQRVKLEEERNQKTVIEIINSASLIHYCAGGIIQ